MLALSYQHTSMACVFILLFVALMTVPGVFTMVKPDRHQAKTSLTTTTTILPPSITTGFLPTTTWPPTLTTTWRPPTTTVTGCISSYDGQFYPQGSQMPAGGGCMVCTCGHASFWSSTVQENCRCLCMCYCSPCVDEVPNGCCPTCPNGPNCNAMGTVIPADRDVQVDGYTCRCPHATVFPPAWQFGKRSVLAGRGSRANHGCDPYREAVCQPIITG
ncbi:uncharacterized protein LOC144914505 [Branchiostoma floridae x Branchiostoma belcheri]